MPHEPVVTIEDIHILMEENGMSDASDRLRVIMREERERLRKEQEVAPIPVYELRKMLDNMPVKDVQGFPV